MAADIISRFLRRAEKPAEHKSSASQASEETAPSRRGDRFAARAIAPPRLDDDLQRALVASIGQKVARGEIWDGDQFRREAAAFIRDGQPQTQSFNSAATSYFSGPDAKRLSQAAIALNVEDRVAIPGDAIAAILNSDIPFTDKGLCIANATIVGEVRPARANSRAPTSGASDSGRQDDLTEDEIREGLKKGGKNALPKNKKTLPDDYGIDTYSPAVIRTNDPLKAAIPGLYFCRCRIIGGGFIASNIAIKGNVYFEKCLLEYVYLGNSDIAGNVTFEDCRLLGLPSYADIVNPGSHPQPGEVCGATRTAEEDDADPAIEPRASFCARDAHIQGAFRLIDTLCVYGANLDRSRIEGSAYFYGSHLQCYKHPYDIAALSMDYARVAGSLWLSGRHKYGDGTQKPPITYNDLSTDPSSESGPTQPRNRLFCAIGGINLRGARIGGSLRCSGAVAVPFSWLWLGRKEPSKLPLTEQTNDIQQGIVQEIAFLGDAHEVDSAIRAAGIDVAHDVDLHNKFAALGILDFTSSRIGRQFNFRLHPWRARIQLWPSRHLEGIQTCGPESSTRASNKPHEAEFHSEKKSASPGHRLRAVEVWLAFKPVDRKHILPSASLYLDLEDSTISDTLRLYADRYHFNYLEKSSASDREDEPRASEKRGKRLDIFTLAPPERGTLPKLEEAFGRCVIDLRSVETETYTDDFDASDKVGWRFYSVISTKRSWPDEMVLHLEGFNYKRIRVDTTRQGGEDLLSFRTRNQWLRTQYAGKILYEREERIGQRNTVEHINRTPLIGFFAWRFPLLILSSILLFGKVPWNAAIAFGRWWQRRFHYEPRLKANKLVPLKKGHPTRDYIKIDWKPREWRQFQPGPWLHCARVLRESGRHSDSRHLMLLRERYGLLDERAVQLEKFWRHAVLMLAGHSYRRRRLIGWGALALMVMFLNYQIAFEAGLMVPAEAEVLVSDEHLSEYLNPPSLTRPNVTFFAIEKLTPGLNFQLEEFWVACSEPQITLARNYASCVGGDKQACGLHLGNQRPPLACLPRDAGYSAPNWRKWVRALQFWNPPAAPAISGLPQRSDCLADLSGGLSKLSGCWNDDITQASRTARWLFLHSGPFGNWLKSWLNFYYLSGHVRIGGWLLMLFGWLLVGIGAASFAGMLHRED